MSEVQETRKPSKLKLTYIVTAVAVSCLMIGASLGQIIFASDPNTPAVLGPGSMEDSATYVIFKDGTGTHAKDGATGAMAYSSTSSSLVIQYAIDAIAAQSGGKIFLKLGNYMLLTMLNISKAHISIDAESGTVFTSALLPCFVVYGAYDFDTFPYSLEVNDVQITNLGFYYTGAVANYPFVYIHKVQCDPYVPGQFKMENIKITSSQSGTPTQNYFAGLCIEDIVGGQFNHITVTHFGTGVLLNGTHRHDMMAGGHDWSSNNVYQYVDVARCQRGIWYTGDSHSNGETWIAPKIMHITQIGFKTESYFPTNLMLISPQFEAISDSASTGLYAECGSVTVIDGFFSGIGDAVDGNGIILLRGYGALANMSTFSATIQNCVFSGVIHAIITQRNTTLIGNVYSYNTGVTYPVTRLTPDGNVTSINDGYVLKTRGSAMISASTSVTFNHNMSETPKLVICSFNSSATGAWGWTATSTQVTIAVANSGTYIVYWECESW